VLPKNGCEWAQIAADVWIWHRNDPAVKAELFSTALRIDERALLIDPILPLPAEVEGTLPPVAAVLVTNGNHARDAQAFSNRFSVPVHAAPGAHDDLDLPEVRDISTTTEFGSLTIMPIEGAAAGEIALHSSADGGTLVIGDALINMGSYGFTFLPAKYRENHKLMRRSVRVVLDFDFERMLFAHGLPIVTDARQRLATLLESGA
jgi:hypothetical protein